MNSGMTTRSPRGRLHAGACLLALATCLAPAEAAVSAPSEAPPAIPVPARPPLANPGERVLDLDAERQDAIREEVERALSAELGENVKHVSLGLCQPQLVRKGSTFELRFEKGDVVLTELDVGGIRVTGRVRFRDLRLDYAALGIGRFELAADPEVYPDLSTTLADLETFMSKQGLRDTFVRFDPETGELELGGRRPVRVLLFRANPHVTVRGRFALEDNKVSFQVADVQVRDAGGPVVSAVRRRVLQIASRSVDLDEVLAGLKVRGVRVGGGLVRVVSDSGLLFSHELAAAHLASDL